MPNFFTTVEQLQSRHATVLCLGLDPRPHHLTAVDREQANPLAAWGERLIRDCADYLCCIKPNIAFYEAQGSYGWEALKLTIATAHAYGLPVLLDAKRGDIGSTAEAYAVAAFDELGADAITLSPYLGRDSADPFLRMPGRGLFMLCHTSNPTADEFQTLEVNGQPLYEVVAQRATQWDERVGLVVGATYPHAIAAVRALAPETWLLLPGIGAQGGDEKAALTAARHRVIVPVSRGIMDAEEPREAARALRDKLNRALALGEAAGDAALSPLQQRIAEALASIGALRFGEFTLASGDKSPVYVDLRLLVAHPQVLSMVARAYVERLATLDLRYDVLAALPYAALPIGTAVSLYSGDPLIYPRKEAKEYGTHKLIEGVYHERQIALMLDDVVSTGVSKVKALAPLRNAGLRVEDLIVLVDRSGGRAMPDMAEHGLRLHSILTLEQIVEHLAARGLMPTTQRDEVLAYLKR